MHAIVWGITLAEDPRLEILFPKGDEDPDHMVVSICVESPVTSVEEGWRTARRLLDGASLEKLAEWRAQACRIDRGALGSPFRTAAHP